MSEVTNGCKLEKQSTEKNGNGCTILTKACKMSPKSHGSSTRAIHTGKKSSHWTHSPVVTPLYLSTTFETLEPGKEEYLYSRGENPTRDQLEMQLAAIESAKYALSFSSGMGAITTATFLLKSGQHMLVSDDVYGGTYRFFTECTTRMGLEASFVDATKLDSWAANFRPGVTKMVWIETPTNPTMKIADIAAICEEIKRLDKECLVVIDNTFMTPVFQSPLKLGADIVMHSCTKYINGHSDVIMGALMTDNRALYEKLKFFQNALGIISSPFDCSLVIRSIKTLHVRVKQQTASAAKVAKFLESHPLVERVLYPGLPSHPQHELAVRQLSGFGGMLSVYIKQGTGLEARRMLKTVRVFHTAVSLGCVCSLIEIPELMTHSGLPEEDRIKLGITNNFLRLSIGLEDVDDLIEDLDNSLKSAFDGEKNQKKPESLFGQAPIKGNNIIKSTCCCDNNNINVEN